MTKISVIIPLYNDERHIERCLRHICNQSIRDQIEVIIIADGCTDHSVEIAQGILETVGSGIPSRVIVLPQNKGVANARKVGIVEAAGVFVMFCDSDDYMASQMCEKLLSKAEDDGCDMVVCDYQSIKGERVEVVTDCYKENFLQQLILCTVTGSLCNKLIKTALLRRSDFIFPVRDFSEDYVYCLQLAIFARKIGYVPEPLYNYVHRFDSVVQSSSAEKNAKRYDEDMDNFRLDLEILQKHGLMEKYREEIISHKLKMKNSNRNNPEFWHKTFPELRKEIFKSKYVTWRSRLAYLLNLVRIR